MIGTNTFKQIVAAAAVMRYGWVRPYHITSHAPLSFLLSLVLSFFPSFFFIHFSIAFPTASHSLWLPSILFLLSSITYFLLFSPSLTFLFSIHSFFHLNLTSQSLVYFSLTSNRNHFTLSFSPPISQILDFEMYVTLSFFHFTWLKLTTMAFNAIDFTHSILSNLLLFIPPHHSPLFSSLLFYSPLFSSLLFSSLLFFLLCHVGVWRR